MLIFFEAVRGANSGLLVGVLGVVAGVGIVGDEVQAAGGREFSDQFVRRGVEGHLGDAQ